MSVATIKISVPTENLDLESEAMLEDYLHEHWRNFGLTPGSEQTSAGNERELLEMYVLEVKRELAHGYAYEIAAELAELYGEEFADVRVQQ